MKILLANLPWKKGGLWGVRAGSRWPHIKTVQEKTYLPFPFFLAYAGSLLEREGFEVKLIDALAEEMPTGPFLKAVSKEKPDLLVAETSAPSLGNDLSILTKIPRDLPIALCGPETSIRDPEFLSRHPFIHYVFTGEYEFTLLELVQRLTAKKNLAGLCGLIYRDNEDFKVNPPRPLLENLDDLPWPLRDGLPMGKYNDTPGGIPLPSVQMWSSRGCPYQCLFCVWPQLMYHKNRYRIRNIVKIVDEMEYLVKKKGFKSIYFDDDTANIGKLRMMEFAEEIKRRALNVPWAMMARADLMEEDILERLRSAGLSAIKYGVESSNQELLNRICKSMDLRKTERMIRFTQSLGIKTHLTFSFGLPGETQETIQRTIEFAKELNPDSLQFSIVTAFPGTSYFQALDQKGHIVSRNLSDYDGNFKSMLRTDSLSSQDLEKAKRQADEIWQAHVWKTRHSHFQSRDYFRRFKGRVRDYGLYHALSKAFSFVRTQIAIRRSPFGTEFFGAFSFRRDLTWESLRGTVRRMTRKTKKYFVNILGISRNPDVFHGPEALLVICPMCGTSTPPMGPAYIAAYLEQQGTPCEILDLNMILHDAAAPEHKPLWKMENLHAWTEENAFESIRRIFAKKVTQWAEYIADHGFRTVGFSISGANILFSIEMAKLLKKENPDICIVFGGPSCNFLRDDPPRPFRFFSIGIDGKALIKDALVDYFVLGEGEESFFEIVSAKRSGASVDRPGVIPGSVHDMAAIRKPVFIKDLDSLSFPAWEKMPLKKYDVQDEFPILFGRGCINRCAFCNDWGLWGGRYRSRSAGNILEEMKFIQDRFGKNRFCCNDLLFNANLKLLDELADQIIDSGRTFYWSAQGVVRTDMTLELLQKLKRAGMVSIVYGVESLADNVLRKMGKPFTFDDIHTVLKRTKSAGLNAWINLITGFPGETEEDFRITQERLGEIRDCVDGVSSLNPCNITASTELEMFPDRFGVVFPKGRDGCEFWETVDGMNTFEVRKRRACELYAFMKQAKIKVMFMGIYDGDSPLQREPALQRPEGVLKRLRSNGEMLLGILNDKRNQVEKYCVNMKSYWLKIKRHYLNILGIYSGSYAFKGPDCVQIDLTNNCNNNCVSCWCNSPLLGDKAYRGSKKYKTLPTQLIKTVIDELAGMGTSELYFSGGGEPFMHPDLLSIIEYASKRGLYCCINTNFTLVDEMTVKKLIELPVDALTVSVWAATPETYVLTHPNKDEATFHKIKSTLAMLNSLKKDGKPFVKIYNVISNLNCNELEQMVEFAKGTGSEAVEFTVVDTIPGATDRLVLSSEERKSVLEQCERIQKRSGVPQVLNLEHFMRRLSDTHADRAQYDSDYLGASPCYIGWVFSRIMPDGDVNFCLKAHRIPVGNLYKSSFSEIWNSKEQREFRQKALKFDKEDSFFQKIGNDENCKMGCYKSCDDIGRNRIVAARMNSLSYPEKVLLKIISKTAR